VPNFQHFAALGRVLIVEDDSGARELIAEALRLTGYLVRTAADGLAALRQLEAFEPDVVVLDLGLPIASGFEVLHEIRSAAKTVETPVIAISGLVNGVKLAKANPEFFDILPKPFDPDTLIRMVKRAFRARS
jgi:two-component system, OmpR family, response regulator MprA